MRYRKFLITCTCLLSVAAFGQNVGIGTTTPSFPLDVAGRIHFKHNGQKTPGIYFDGANGANRGFIGHSDDNHIGFFGGGGAGWMLAMNFYNGFTAIGHGLPTATLDVQGGIRLRLPGAGAGYSVISADGNGNADWERPVAFKVAGSSDPSDVNSGPSLPNGQWVKPVFTNIPEYNIGIAWEPINQEFVAPARGMYHFDGHFQTSGTAAEVACHLMRKRNGADTELHTANHRYQLGNAVLIGYHAVDFSADFMLEAGDRIRVELRGVSSQYGTSISPQPSHMFFSGRLVTAL